MWKHTCDFRSFQFVLNNCLADKRTKWFGAISFFDNFLQEIVVKKKLFYFFYFIFFLKKLLRRDCAQWTIFIEHWKVQKWKWLSTGICFICFSSLCKKYRNVRNPQCGWHTDSVLQSLSKREDNVHWYNIKSIMKTHREQKIRRHTQCVSRTMTQSKCSKCLLVGFFCCMPEFYRYDDY